MEKKKVTVMVAGQKFNIITEEKESYVIDLASRIDAHIASLTAANMTREKAAVLTALDFADDIEQNRRAMNEIKEQIKDYIRDLETLGRENAGMKEQLEKISAEMNGKDAVIDALKKETEELKNALNKAKVTDNNTVKTENADAKEEKSLDQETKTHAADESAKENAVPTGGERAENAGEDEFDDLPFDEPIQGIFKNAPAPQKPAETAAQTETLSRTAPAPNRTQNQPAPKKKKHEHNYVNPFKQQFMQNKEKGYTPQRQYSLFDAEDE